MCIRDSSKDRVAKVFVAIGKDQLTDIIEEDHGAEVGCQFCNSKYQFTEEELREILGEM